MYIVLYEILVILNKLLLFSLVTNGFLI
jgi:hypothetical protein